MILQLRELFRIDGKRMPIDYAISPEELSYLHGYRFSEPITVKGELRNRLGVVTLHYTVSCTLDTVCDRCLKPLRKSFTYDFDHTVVRYLEDENDWNETYLVAEQDALDMNETAMTDLLLMIPTKILCKEDCKGLCAICGCDLNVQTCDCLQ